MVTILFAVCGREAGTECRGLAEISPEANASHSRIAASQP